jgi:hypothetical protein
MKTYFLHFLQALVGRLLPFSVAKTRVCSRLAMGVGERVLAVEIGDVGLLVEQCVSVSIS